MEEKLIIVVSGFPVLYDISLAKQKVQCFVQHKCQKTSVSVRQEAKGGGMTLTTKIKCSLVCLIHTETYKLQQLFFAL